MITEPLIARHTLRCDRSGCSTYFQLDIETNQLAPKEIRCTDAFQTLAHRAGWTNIDGSVLDLRADGEYRCPICTAADAQ